MKLVTWTIIYKRIVEKRSYLKLNLNDINLPQAFVTDFVSDFTGNIITCLVLKFSYVIYSNIITG